MLIKILFTILVITVVVLIFRIKASPARPKAVDSTEIPGSLSVRTVTLLILAVLMAISATIFIFQYRTDNRIINIKVFDTDGTSTIYQARQKSIKGRQFETLDKHLITLGESDRIEMKKQ